MGLCVIVAIGVVFSNYIYNRAEYCKTNDCRSVEEYIIDEIDETTAGKICIEEYGVKTSENIPERCKKILGV